MSVINAPVKFMSYVCSGVLIKDLEQSYAAASLKYKIKIEAGTSMFVKLVIILRAVR